MRKLSVCLFAFGGLVVLAALSKSQPTPDDTRQAIGSGQPLIPAEALKQFKIAPGLRIELVAAEPLVQSPVAIAFDARGRLWVVEMPDYPNGPPKGKPAEGRIRILEDTKGDGVFNRATTFADELLFANGLLPWKDGVIVTAAPYIISLQDPQGIGRATKKDVLFQGFAVQNPQLRVSHPILGLDGWVYVANGLRGGRVVKASTRNPQPIDLSGLDFRFDPVSLESEAVSGPGQFGNTFDDWGNRFLCDNRHHLRHVVLENRYVRRNPNLAPGALVEDISALEDGPLNSGGKVYPISKNWTTSSLHEGRFTAACGVHIYRGNLLPREFQGAAFTCEPTGNLVHMETLTPHGATFRSQPTRPGNEFLATPDDWFRPVSIASGPDGAMYIVDMYRAVIEHPEFMPPELKNRPDLTLGKDRGRIWRIVPADRKAKSERPNLAKASTKDLVAALEDPDGWRRGTAARLLFERKDPAAPVPLFKLLSSRDKDARARIQAAWLLSKYYSFPADFDQLLTLLKDPHPRLREQAVLLSERFTPYSTIAHNLRALGDDPDARVRYQVALSLGNWTTEKNYSVLAKIALAGADDKWTRLAVASSAGDCAGKIIEEFLSAVKFKQLPLAWQTTLLQEFATLVGARQDPQEIAATLTGLTSITGPDALQMHLPAMAGLADGVTRRSVRMADMMARLPLQEQFLAWSMKFENEVRGRAVTPKGEPGLRFHAVRYLAHLPFASVQETLTSLIDEDPSQDIRIAAVRALAAHADRHVPSLLLKGWRSYTPPVRREVLEAMFRDPLRINALLDAVDAKQVKAGDIDAFRARQLLAHGNPGIRERARKMLRDSLPAERKEVLDKYQVALAMDGDAQRGQEIFKKNCATCHKVAGIGIDVGPDIGDSRTKTESALLVDILNPNQAIDNNYINYLVTTKNGRTLTGLLTAETASSVTLKRAEGQTDVVLRQEIDTIESTGVSLMPEGLEKAISIQEMADLLKFLKHWRYLDGSVPLGK